MYNCLCGMCCSSAANFRKKSWICPPWHFSFHYLLNTKVTLVPLYFKVIHLEERLADWRQKLKQLRTDYDKLLFFHIPKLLRMYKMLYHDSSVLANVPQLVQEVSFLFDSTVDTREHLTASLQVRIVVCVCVCVCFLLLDWLSNKNGTYSNSVAVPRRQQMPLLDARPSSASGDYTAWHPTDRWHPSTT